jgi:uncharacterized protein YprB with RNaseH-like and TPR domain
MSTSFRSLKAFQRLRPSRIEESDSDWPPRPADVEVGSSTRADSIRAIKDRVVQILGGRVKANQYGEHLSVRYWCAQPARFLPDLRALKLLLPDNASEIADPDQWLFLDTETTGLAGGSGTYPFLIGVAWWEDGGLEIEQLFMRDYDEERSLLHALKERIADHPVVVTFNGKSFDWPLLETRYRMSRRIAVPVMRAHLDFLHPARNLWRLRLGSAKLSELERHVLGWDRGIDLTSGLIPQIYFNYLHGGPPEPLISVLNHNQMDLRGLALLSSRILSLLSDVENLGQDGLELFGVSRICEKRREHIRARYLYEKSIASILPAATDQVARRSLAKLAKRQGDFDLACQLWRDALGNSRHGYEAYEQLAIYYEGKGRDFEKARQIVDQALDQLRCAMQSGDIALSAYHEIHTKFDRRLERLIRKSKQPILAALAQENS